MKNITKYNRFVFHGKKYCRNSSLLNKKKNLQYIDRGELQESF